MGSATANTRKKHDFLSSLGYAVAMHLMLFAIMFFFCEPEKVEVSFEITLEPDIERIPKEVRETIEKEIKKVEKAKTKKATTEQAKKSEKAIGEKKDDTSTRANTSRDPEDQFIEDFEKQLFSKKSNYSSPQGGRTGEKKSWEQEGTSGQQGTKKSAKETVKIPEGTTGTGTVNWRGGYSRRLVYKPPIPYPQSYRKQGIQASALISIEVDAAGKVILAEVLRSSGHPRLDIIAKNAMRRARFSASPRQGVIDKGEIEIKFELNR